jgi:conjugative transposon TraJ protein
MQKRIISSLIVVLAIAFPFASHAQDANGSLADSIQGLQGVLEQLYNNMIVQCSQLIGVGRGIAGIAATWYIAYRVWGNIARAEPIDFYPLLRPFALGLAIINFPIVIAIINGIMQPAASQTSAWVTSSDAAIARLLQEKQEAYQTTTAYQMYLSNNGEGDKEAWEKYSGDADNSWTGGLSNSIRFALDKAAFNLKNTIKVWLSEVLQLLYEAAALCINTIRTFYLIILAILGPLVFGLSVFDGFGHTLRHWLAKYINVFLWLPVCNIFGSIINTIQEQMIQIDINQIKNAGDTAFGATDTAYLIFLVIAIAGYFTVPSVAGYIVSAGGHSLLSRTNTLVSHAASMINLRGQSTSSPQAQQVLQGPMARAASGGSFGTSSSSSSYQYNRVKGNT